MWKQEGIEEVSTVLILFQRPLRENTNLGGITVWLYCSQEGRKQKWGVLEFGSGVRDDSCGG